MTTKANAPAVLANLHAGGSVRNGKALLESLVQQPSAAPAWETLARVGYSDDQYLQLWREVLWIYFKARRPAVPRGPQVKHLQEIAKAARKLADLAAHGPSDGYQHRDYSLADCLPADCNAADPGVARFVNLDEAMLALAARAIDDAAQFSVAGRRRPNDNEGRPQFFLRELRMWLVQRGIGARDAEAIATSITNASFGQTLTADEARNTLRRKRT